MVAKGEEAKRARSESECSSQRLKEDRISQLPDPLICHILSHLPTKESVSTSALSTRWKSLWLWVPDLELNFFTLPDTTAFASVCDRFFDSNRVSCIRKVKLDVMRDKSDDDVKCICCSYSYLNAWIDAAVKRKIQHLELFNLFVFEMTRSLFTCETLVVLKLRWVYLPDGELVFHLPRLKTMHLMRLFYPNEASFEKLVSSCPVLEDLKVSVARNDPMLYRVRSRSVKKLDFARYVAYGGSVLGAEIDAPLLDYLKIHDNVSDSFVVNNLESNTKLDMSLDFSSASFQEGSESARTSRIRSFVPGISKLRDMTADAGTFKVIHDYSILEPLPQFRSLSRLHATLCVSDVNWLPTFLESCPNLKSLILVALNNYEEFEEMIQFSCSSVPECLLSSLEFVDFNIQILGYAAEMELAKYFLENSTILKKLTLHVNHGSIDSDISNDLLRVPRRSATCEVVVI